jgi:tetratricopeptide (TPR) repeat protein
MAKCYLYAIALFLFGALSCNLIDSSDERNAERILNSPPYEGLTDSIHETPGDVALYLKRAELLMQNKQADLAVQDYEEAWRLQPDEFTAMRYTAGLFMSGREKQAIELLTECMKRFPDNTEFPRRLSEAYLQSGRPRDALKQYNIIVEKDPENFEAWYERGLILSEMKDTAEAISSLERAYELQPLQSFGLMLANLYAETGNVKAIALCDALISRDVEQQAVDPIFLKGVYFANAQQPALAVAQFDTCIRRDWKFIEAYIEKGIVQFQTGSYEEALETFNLAKQVTNTYPDAYFWIGRCHEATGNIEEAAENYYRALALDGSFTEAKEGLRRLRKV